MNILQKMENNADAWQKENEYAHCFFLSIEGGCFN